MSRTIPKGIRPLSEVRFDFESDRGPMGLPFAYVAGVNVDIFALPIYVCDGEALPRCSWAWGCELALIALADMRSWHLCEGTRDLNSVIELPDAGDLGHFVRMAFTSNGNNGWHYGSHSGFFGTLELALNHAVTARGDPERDGMIASELDQLTSELAESRLRAVLASERVPEIGYRVSKPT